MKKVKIIIVLIVLLVVMILAFGTMFIRTGVSDQTNYRDQTEYKNPNYKSYLSVNDIIKGKGNLKGLFKLYYDKYIPYTAPNGKNIFIVATKDITDEQLLYGYSVLYNYLNTNTLYDMDSVANHIADSGSYIVMVGGTDGEATIPTFAILGQPLYYTEVSVPGSKWFMENDYEHRDASFEEILHFTHDYGIGTSGNTGALPDFSKRIKEATFNALPEDKTKWGIEGLWAFQVADNSPREWLLELEKEGSLEQEYLASVIDSYYGMWGAFNEVDGGMWGMYVAKTREEITTKDPVGNELLDYFNPYMSSMICLDSSLEGDFYLSFNENLLYTYKSQYYQYVRITGENKVNIHGNNQNNLFIGNNNENIFDGVSGFNVVQYDDVSGNYTVEDLGDKVTVKNNETGVIDVLVNIQVVRFMDVEYEI